MPTRLDTLSRSTYPTGLAQNWPSADVAQLAEHLICNQAVASSILAVSSGLSGFFRRRKSECVKVLEARTSGGVAEWLMAADCKSAGFTPYEGSNPSPTIRWLVMVRACRAVREVEGQTRE